MSATITEYSPDGMETAGNSRIVVIPTVANIDAITVAEFNSGTAIECAIERFGPTIDVAMREVRKLCDKRSREIPGNRKVSIEDIEFELGDPQAENKLVTLLAEDSTVVLVHRPGIDHRDPAAAAQKYQAIRGMVASLRLAPLSTDEGDTYRGILSLSVQDMNDGFLAKLVA